MRKYIAKEIKRTSQPDKWTEILVGVFELQDDKTYKQIGQYERNYGLMRTFYAFQHSGKWFALYSSHYMYTRIMELPSCKDIGGEDNSNVEYKDHFCPVEYYVPKHYMKAPNWYPRPKRPDTWGKDWGEKGTPLTEEEKKSHDEWNKASSYWIHNIALENKTYLDFGFVSGCAWGDDSYWKLEYLDLKNADKGIIKREAKFGYWELPNNLRLNKAIHVICAQNDYYDSKHTRITIATHDTVDYNDSEIKILRGDWIPFDQRQVR